MREGVWLATGKLPKRATYSWLGLVYDGSSHSRRLVLSVQPTNNTAKVAVKLGAESELVEHSI